MKILYPLTYETFGSLLLFLGVYMHLGRASHRLPPQDTNSSS